MKTKQILVAALVFASLSFGNVSASENASASNAMKHLTDQITQSFKTTPFELINEPSDLIVVEFKIDQNHKFDLVKVIGKNEDLANYSKIALQSKNIIVDQSIEPKTYHIPMRFVSE
jgi:hypothetical protein